jgi:N,N'-diacetyllegionaminate synthase
MKTFIVAEIGINHNGNLDTARKLVDVAIDAGADAVKFQTFWDIPELNHLTFSICEWRRLFLFCELRMMKWFSTPFELKAVEFLDDLGMDTWKLPSNKKVLHDGSIMAAIKNAKSRGHTIISTGISDFGEIEDYILYFETVTQPVTLLHCVSKYPTPIKELNLGRILQLRERFNIPVGLSDHSLSVYGALHAVKKMGATIIEKHITLDRNDRGPDQKASIEPAELKTMIRCIREYEGYNA